MMMMMTMMMLDRVLPSMYSAKHSTFAVIAPAATDDDDDNDYDDDDVGQSAPINVLCKTQHSGCYYCCC